MASNRGWTESELKQVRRLYEQGDMTVVEIAEAFDVSVTSIDRVLKKLGVTRSRFIKKVIQ